ncbi:MAG TPA: UDP-N-acetylmuramate--L-alanine ligase [Candidatus Saccharimonadales bacterium]|nr:UDP-N-acetylmuramate--L-alanine ligase [Candidatus Saccharimonadales bacterium]
MKKKAEPKSLYLVGIKGMAMTGLALMAKQLGYEVTGSDVAEVFPTDEVLTTNGIKFFSGFEAAHVKEVKPDLVIASAAFGLQNPELKAAKSARISIIPQSEMLGKIMANFESIGVAGVHGKTTTSSMIAFVLSEAGFSPSYAIGINEIPGLQGNAHIGDGKYFVAEADEYKRSENDFAAKFLDYPLKHIVVTSIELDHPDVYQSAEDVYQAFYQLVAKVPRSGTIVACTDYPLVRRLVGRMADRHCLTYGFEPGAAYQIVGFKEGDSTTFSLKTAESTLGPFVLAMPGAHNVLDAAAAIILTSTLGVAMSTVEKALKKFRGPARRFEVLGQYNNATIITDFAHHPTAIKYLLEATRQHYPNRRVVAVFQPHTYSRTGKLLREFAQSLQNCDRLILLNIFASAREKSGYVTIKDLYDEAKKLQSSVEYRSSLGEVAKYLQSLIVEGDVVLLIGAGDVYKVYDLLQEKSA